MKIEKRRALEAAGWKFGDAADFLEMTPEERQMLELRMSAARAVRRLREEQKLSQAELARRIKTSQPRVARIEQAAPDVSLELILRAYMAAGGNIVLKDKKEKSSKPKGKAAVSIDLD
jgi:ribosome-binding protein aMBF1 (putative translation factor)